MESAADVHVARVAGVESERELGFARRLYADRVGMLFAIRDGERHAAGYEGLPEWRIGGLSDEAAHRLLAGLRKPGTGPTDVPADCGGGGRESAGGT